MRKTSVRRIFTRNWLFHRFTGSDWTAPNQPLDSPWKAIIQKNATLSFSSQARCLKYRRLLWSGLFIFMHNDQLISHQSTLASITRYRDQSRLLCSRVNFFLNKRREKRCHTADSPTDSSAQMFQVCERWAKYCNLHNYLKWWWRSWEEPNSRWKQIIIEM